MVQALVAATLAITATSILAVPILDENLVGREAEPGKFWNTVKNVAQKVEHGIEGAASTVGAVAQGVNSAVDVKNSIKGFRGKREPQPEPGKFWNAVKGVATKVEHGIEGVASTVGAVAQGVNSAVDVKNGIKGFRGKREEPALSARDIELLQELAARDPSFGSFIKGIGKGIGKVASAVAPVAGVVSKFIREEPEELTARDIEILEDLAARDPSFGSFLKGLGKDIGKVASTVAPVVGVASKFIREEPEALSARDIEMLQELAARDPSFGSFIKGIGKGIGKVASAVAPVVGVASKFIREEPVELSARDIELLEELAARDPSFGSFIKGLGKDIGKVAGAVAPVVGVASKFIREEPGLVARSSVLDELD